MVNTEILSELKAHYMRISQRNMLMSAELIRIMKLLKENDIEALAFKGPALSQMVHGDITLRQYSDLDILIHPKNLNTASQLLIAHGYESRVSLDYLNNQAFLNVNHDMNFYKSITVELHWRLFEEQLLLTFDPKLIWDHKEVVVMQNQEINTLEVSNLLIYLCIHGSKHAWERLEWILDIDKLIRTYPKLNWGDILQKSIDLEEEHLLLLGLDLSHRLFHSEIPENIQKNIEKNKKVQDLRKIVFKYFNENLIADAGSKSYYRKLSYFRAQMQKNKWAKLKYIFYNLIKLNSSDIEELPPQKHSHLHYYFSRLTRLIRVYTRTN